MDEIAARDASLLRDPDRRWLRHTYQEGPGFRFLATRGGRPLERRRLGRQFGIVRQRARLLRIAREEGVDRAIELGGCSRTSLWRWQCAYDRGGLVALLPERRGPHHPATRHASWVALTVASRTFLPSATSSHGWPICEWRPERVSETTGNFT
jgi:hypothetical protein